MGESSQEGENLPLLRLGLHRRSGVLGIGNAEKLVEKREGVIELPIETERSAGDLVSHRLVAVAFLDREIVPHDLEDGKKGDRLPVRHAVACKDRDSVASEPLDELVAEAALADSRFSNHSDGLCLACKRPRQRRL